MRLLRIIRDVVACILVSVGIAYCGLGAIYGCGETYFDSDGRQHTYDCPLPVAHTE